MADAAAHGPAGAALCRYRPGARSFGKSAAARQPRGPAAGIDRSSSTLGGTGSIVAAHGHGVDAAVAAGAALLLVPLPTGCDPGRRDRHLGVRLSEADAADAVHRLIVCPDADGI